MSAEDVVRSRAALANLIDKEMGVPDRAAMSPAWRRLVWFASNIVCWR
jgi:hypothetical protein